MKSPVSPGRLAAARTLLQLEARGGRADDVFEQYASGVGGPERGLGWALVLGVERNRSLLDHHLSAHLKRRMRKLDPPIRCVLRCGAFQLLLLDRIPARAAVHQAVETVRTLGSGQAAGLINGALRSLDREPDRCGEPPNPSVALSMPLWLLKRMPEEAAPAFNKEPALALRPRVANLKVWFGEQNIETHDGPAGSVLLAATDPTKLPGWDDGWFAVQDAASQAVGQLVDAQPGERVLDACAAPGGKALALADAVGPEGRVLALDLSSERLALVEPEMARLGLKVETRVGDICRCIDETFDRVLVDAPCSAIGVIRRHPEIRWQRRPEELRRHADTQAKILDASATAVRPGGRLVYAVCSFAAVEGPGVVDSFLARSPEFTRVPIEERWGTARDPEGAFRSWPHLDSWDGFYAAVLQKIE